MAGRSSRFESANRDAARRLGRALRDARVAQRISREELAHRAQVSVSTVQKIEVGPVVEPGYFTVMRLAACLGVDPARAADAGRRRG